MHRIVKDDHLADYGLGTVRDDAADVRLNYSSARTAHPQFPH